MSNDHDAIVAATREWVERAVIGLGLCPFAAGVRDRIRFVVSKARNHDALLDDLERELLALAAADSAQCETTLLVHPGVLADFLDFNDFLDEAEALVAELDLEGVIQVASFHPQYQFADSEPEAIENYTNRSPYPTLHLLREESIERALADYPDPDSIYERNIDTLRRLGPAGWARLFQK